MSGIFTSLFALSVLALLVPSSSALPTLSRDAVIHKRGVSGTVISPAGGTSYGFTSGISTTDGGSLYDADGIYGPGIYVAYQGVSSPSVNYTVSIDVTLHDPTGTLADIPLATRLGDYQHDTIEAYFTPPGTACGYTWQLVFIEHQEYSEYSGTYYEGPYAIKFQSAAPTIYIGCEPWDA